MKLPHVVAVVARKGGVGKSTFARSFAVQALIEGHKAAIIDTDEQATSFKWSRRRKANAPAVMQLAGQTLAEVISELKGRGAELYRHRHAAARPTHHQHSRRSIRRGADRDAALPG